MTLLGVYKQAVLSFLLWLAVARGLLCSDFYVAYVTDHSLNTCRCVRELPHCSEPDASECSCKNHPLSWLLRPDGTSLLQLPRLAVWYSSPVHVALLLHNAEIRYLSLVKCYALIAVPGGGISATSAISTDMATGSATKLASPDHFVVQRLERLTVSPPASQSGAHQDLFLGRELGAAHHEEARIAVINTSVLAGAPMLKAYTVCTGLDAEGVLPFPSLPMLPREGLPDTSSIFVTFLY